MSIEDFINKKQLEVTENENFLKWNETNKLRDEDGYPIIAFHGSTNDDFNIIDLEYSKEAWWCGKGFYTSTSIDDVNANYATALKENKPYISGEDYIAGDLRNRISQDKEEMDRAFENEEDCSFFDYDEISDYILEDEDSKKIDLSVLEDNPDVFNGYNFDKTLISEDNTIDTDALFRSLSVNRYIKNNGWVKPVFVKMENPVYLTVDSSATKISIVDEQLQDFIYQYDTEHQNVMDMIHELSVELSKHVDDSIEDIEEEIKREVSSYVSSYCEDVGEELYDCIKDYIDVNFEFEEEEIIEKISTAFNDNDLGEYNEETEEMEFEHVVIFDVNAEEESEESENLYKEIKNSILNETEDDWEYRAVEETFQNFEMKCLEEGYRDTTLYKLFKAFRQHENEPDLVNCFNRALKEHFDGVVLDAEEENNQWRFNTIGYGTKHYIVFNNKNIKSALGNNGEYSLSNPDIAARKSVSQRINSDKNSYNNILNKLQEYNNTYGSVVSFELYTSSKFQDKNIDALYNREKKTVSINIDKVQTEEELSNIISHEVIGHLGLDLVLGKNKDKFLDKVSSKYKKNDYKEVMKLYPELDYDKIKDRRKLTEEKICFYAEKNFKHDKYMNKVINHIKNGISKFKSFIGINNANDDVFQTLYKSNQLFNQNKKKRRFS